MGEEDLCFTPAHELARLIRRKELSPVEVTDIFLRRISRLNPKLNAYVTLTEDLARRRATELEAEVLRGEVLGPLHGVPYSLKDLTPTRGIRTTFGSKIFEDYIPEEDAVVAERLHEAGGILLGKTNTPEFGCKAYTDNKVFGLTYNPWRLNRTPGGSSGGAGAALAAGLGPLAEGSDLAGSIRIPASFCGVVGFKPTHGRIPWYPERHAWIFGMISHGPMARTVTDVALMFSVMAGHDDRDPLSVRSIGEDFVAAVQGSPNLGGLKVAWSIDLEGVVPVDPEVRRIFQAALPAFTELGAEVEEASPDVRRGVEVFTILGGFLRLASCGRYLPQWADQMDPLLVERIQNAQRYTLANVARAEEARTVIYHTVRLFFQRYDLLVLPTTAVPPWPVEAGYPVEVNGRPIESAYEILLLTLVWNITGQPAISVPCGWTMDGLPVGLQIVGWRYADALVLRAAAAFEAARPWGQFRPPLT